MTTAKSYALNSNNPNGANLSIRQAIPSIAAGGTQIRVTFNSDTTAGKRLTTVHCSIAKQSSGSTASATPVELTFSGASGFDIANNSSITSDWVGLTTTIGDNLLIHRDSSEEDSRQLGPTGDSALFYYKAGVNTDWNQATVSGYSSSPSGYSNGISLVEVQSGTAYSVAAAYGTYSVTGVAAAFLIARKVIAAAGSYAVTGVAAALRLGHFVAAQAGSYVVTGVDAAFHVTRKVIAEAGSYTLTGVAVVFHAALSMTAAAGSYAVSGVAATLKAGLHLTAAAGSYTVTGISLIAVRAVAAATKFKRRISAPTLTKLRSNDPSLED